MAFHIRVILAAEESEGTRIVWVVNRRCRHRIGFVDENADEDILLGWSDNLINREHCPFFSRHVQHGAKCFGFDFESGRCGLRADR